MQILSLTRLHAVRKARIFCRACGSGYCSGADASVVPFVTLPVRYDNDATKKPPQRSVKDCSPRLCMRGVKNIEKYLLSVVGLIAFLICGSF